MKVPRDVSADRLIRLLETLGYKVTRQKGSHARLRHDGPPAHSITVPRHKRLKTGTLQPILAEIARMRSVTVDSLTEAL
jgi:predicted RNA binding protein YcfA (HicA-like mRNA interferase family)